MSAFEDLTIYIIDDDDDIRTSLTRSLTKRGYVVESFSSAGEFLISYNQSNSGCVLLDYGMPELNGLELQQKLIESNISIPLIFMTGHGGIPESVQAMKSGAVDFLEKPFQQDALLEAITTAFERVKMANKNDLGVKALKTKLESLTAREKEVAKFIVQNPAETSSKIIGRHLGVSPRTIDHHRARILEKMNVASVAELIEKALIAKLFTL